MTLPLSCYIVVRRGSVDVTGALHSVCDLVDDVIVVGSALGTRELGIVKAWGVRVIDSGDVPEAKRQRFIEEHCRHDWLLSLHGDERLSEGLRRELITLFRGTPRRECYRLGCVDVYPVSDYPRLWARRRWQTRLYRRGGKRAGKLSHPILKSCPGSFEALVAEQNALSSRDAQRGVKGVYGVLWLRLFTEPMVAFLRAYVRDRHIMGGVWGFAYSIMEACHYFTRVVKMVEKHKGWNKMPKIAVKSRKLEKPLPISCCIIAKDEADRITLPLRALRGVVADIVVVDSGSGDDTAAVARANGARVVKRAWQGYGEQKRFAEAQCRHDWVLNLDADEWPSADLLDELQGVMALPDKQRARAYTIRRVDCYSGEAMPRKRARAWSIVRFYDRRRARFNAASFAEEVVVPKGVAVGHLTSLCYHYPIRSMDDFWRKENRTTSWVAAKGKSLAVLLLRLVIECPFTFVRMYIIKGGYRDGLRGYIRSMSFAFVYALRIIKKLEYRRWLVR